jgi:ABC-type lipoprotein release transport system permease subunit
MKIWRMAFRNILRMKRRSLITTLAMAFALGIMIVYSCLMDGLVHDMEKNATMLEMGHVQIHAPGYLESPSIYKRIEDPESLVASLQNAGFHASYRLFASGLAARGNASAGVQFRGVDPTLESDTTRLPHHLLEGKWLDEKEPKNVVLGKRLAQTLSAKVSDEIVVVSQASDGSIANELYIVAGILKSVGEIVDRSGLFMTVSAFRELMVMPEGSHEIVIAVPPEQELQDALPAIKKIAQGLDVKTWEQLNPALAEMINSADAFLIPLIVITYMAIAIVILNAMLMAVFERIHEYGVMKALGVGPFSVFRLVLIEAFIMTHGAAILGLATGVPLAFYLETHGIDLGIFAQGATISGVAIDLVWRSLVSVSSILMPLIFLYILVLLGTMYPAIKAARLKPVDAIHHH